MSGAPPPGTILAGKYRVDGVLGEGGMGIVVRAHHEVLHQQVALKFLTGAAATNGDAVERFLRDARAAVKIQSEHVARIIDVGTLDSGSPFMVMELLEGSDLSDVLRMRGPMHVAQAVDSVLQALDAIAEAHAIGIIHRDLKPSNLFLASRADGTDIIKVLDFGISKVTFAGESSAQAALTATQQVMGSPLYMSPEQFRSAKKVDPRSDIWSLGVILYELLTGRPPFDGESMGEVFSAVLENEPASVRVARPDVPPGLEQVVMRCLRKPAKERFAHAGELARALAPFGSGRANKCVERAASLAARASSPQLPAAQDSGARLPHVAAPMQTAPAPHGMAPMKGPVAQTANTWSDISGAPAATRSNRKLLAVGGIGAGLVLLIGVPAIVFALTRNHGAGALVTADSASASASAFARSTPLEPTTAAAGGSAPIASANASASVSSVPSTAPVVPSGKPPASHTSRPRVPTTAAQVATTPAAASTPPKPSAKPVTVDLGRL
jgi:serine/threonine-protein kinase